MAEWKIAVDADKIIHIEEDDFEATISAVYTHGNQVVENKMVQLFVPGAEPIEPLETDENGRISAEGVVIHTNAKKIVVKAQAVGYATMGKKEIILPRPEIKKTRKVARLVTLNKIIDADSLVITLARVDEAEEGKAGKIHSIEDKATKITIKDTDEYGVAILSFPLQERKRKVTIFLPEKPEQKIELEIPAKKIPAPPTPQKCAEEPEKPKAKLSDRLKKAYRRGRQG